jgi:hypothetical protein
MPYRAQAIADAAKVEETAHMLQRRQYSHVERLALADSLAVSARWLMRSTVDDARRAGTSWAQIAGVLGISRQAAQQRFGGPPDPVEPARASLPLEPESSPVPAGPPGLPI